MTAPLQMTAHTLDALKNSITNPHHLDFAAKLSANVTIDPLYAGRVVHLNSVGEYETGLPNVQYAGHMALFTWQGSKDYDVVNEGDVATDANGWVGTSPTGTIKTLVAVGAWELESTEFQPAAEVSGAAYNPGDCLTATHANTNATTGGRLTKAVAYAAPICGVVSRGVYANCHRKSVLAFWPVWLPKSDADQE